MSHSRSTQGKVYRVQMGYPGLLQAFTSLEVMQKHATQGQSSLPNIDV